MLTQERLKEVLNYDPETGVFTWRMRPSNRVKIGAVAGRIDAAGYRGIRVDRTLYYAHRLAWLWLTGAWPAAMIDHKNGSRDDNRRDNLRAATSTQNAWNTKTPRNNSSGVKGVSWHKSSAKWEACLWVQGEKRRLGLFLALEDAREAYTLAAREAFGDFVRA